MAGFRNKTITTVVRPKDFNLDKVSKVVLREHFHPLPTCAPGAHNATCASFGREIGCVRVIAGHEKPTEIEPLGKVMWERDVLIYCSSKRQTLGRVS
jgi:hypothetical protein